MQFLTPVQREDYCRYGLFTVESQFHRRYQIAELIGSAWPSRPSGGLSRTIAAVCDR